MLGRLVGTWTQQPGAGAEIESGIFHAGHVAQRSTLWFAPPSNLMSSPFESSHVIRDDTISVQIPAYLVNFQCL